MSATAHLLQEQPLPGEAQPQPGLTAQPAGQHALIEDLRSSFSAELADLLRTYFAEARISLPRMAETAASDLESRKAYDCLQVLDLEEQRLTRLFERETGRGFVSLLTHGQAMEVERLALLPAEELDENLRLSRMAAKARTQYKTALADIDSRIHRLSRDSALPLSTRALAPLKICEAFRASLDGLDLDFAQRNMLLTVFERSFMEHLQPAYEAALRTLDQYRILPSEQAAPLPVDEGTLALLTSLGGFASSASFSDATLAAELLAIARGKFTPNGDALRQRMALVGAVFNEILSDPLIPDSLRPLFPPLHFAALKTALADASFVTQHTHPVRWMIQDAAQMAASACLGHEAAVNLTRSRLEKLPQEFNISAAFVTPTLATAELLPHGRVHEFLDMVRAETQARRSELMTKSRRIVSQEIEVCSLGRHLPPAVQQFLRIAIAPMLSWRLLKHGLNSPAWNSALDRVQKLIECFDADVQQRTSAADTETLLDNLSEELAGMELGQNKLPQLMQDLRETLQQRAAVQATSAPVTPLSAPKTPILIPTIEIDFDVEAAALPPTATVRSPSPTSDNRQDLLATLLRPDHWFRVYDARHNEAKWLKVSRYYREHDRVSFAGFNNENVLTLRGADFAEDLKLNRSEPINPSQPMQSALTQLRTG